MRIAIEAQRPFRAEIYTTYELHRQLAQRVRAAKEHGAWPLILSGNCNSALGTLGGIEAHQAGIIWFDAHGDFNTPETTTGGFLDGMALATATGRCWLRMTQSIPGLAPVPDERVLMIGVRQLDDGEQALLEQSQVTLVRGEQIRELGLLNGLEQAITLIAQQFKIAAAAFTAYDPSCDPEENILRAGLQLVEHVVQEVEKREHSFRSPVF
jgi:arginase